MKKLMTLLSAAAVAFGLQAADTGTSFEGMSAGDLDITDFTGELLTPETPTPGQYYWETNGSDKVSLTVVNEVSVPLSDPNRPPQFKTSQTNYLKVATTFGNPVSRKIKTSGGETIDSDTGFYFDSLVKFTAFDEDPMTTAVTNDFEGAKIAVWVQEVTENDVVTSTNLYVRAGYLGGDPQTYDCGALQSRWFANGWNRLTIKAIRSIYKSGSDVPGFVVFIDGEQVGSSADKGIDDALLNDKYEGFYTGGYLFPSMVTSGAGATALSSVSFDGQGDVDDMVFTATAPDFAKDAEYVHINWTPADITALTIGGTELTSEQIAAGSYKIAYEDDLSVAVSATYVEGKLDGTWTTTGGATVSDGTFSFTASEETGTIIAANAAASFAGTPYADLAVAVAAANAATAQLQAPVLKLFGTTSADGIAIENANEVLIELDLNGQTVVGAISALTPLSIVDRVGGGVVEGEVYFDASGSIAAGTYNANVSFGAAGAITGGKFLASENTASALNPFAPNGKEFVAGTGDDAGYLVLGNKAETYTIKFISGEGSETNTYEIADGAQVVAPTPVGVAGKSFWMWDPAVVSPAAADATYTAQYTNNQYTITYKNADGTAFTSWAQDYDAPTSFTIAIVETLPIAENVTLALGATFEGWTNAVGTVVANTQGLTDHLVVFAKLGASGSGGWAVEPDENKTAAQQYPALADSALATANAKDLTDWATDKGLSVGDVAVAAKDSDIYDAYLLNCDVKDVEDERAAFVPSITIVDGEVTVTEPAGEFNGRLIKRAKADLGDNWTENPESDDGYYFFQYELVP